MMNRKQNRGKLISEYSGDIFLKGKSFPADTELRIKNYESRIIQRILTSHKKLQCVMRDGFKHMIKPFNYSDPEQIQAAGLKTSARDYGLAAGLIRSGTGFAL